MDSPFKATSFSITAFTNENEQPKDWWMEGSTDNNTWTYLYSRNDDHFEPGTTYNIPITSPGYYKFYRFHCSAAWQGDYVTVDEIKFFGSYQNTPDTLKTTEPIKNGDNLVIVKDDNSVHEVVASGVVGSTSEEQNIQMTDSTTDGVVVTHTTVVPTYEGWNIFSYDIEKRVSFYPIEFPMFVKIETPDEKILVRYKITPLSPNNTEGRCPKEWTIQGSHDDITYDILDTRNEGQFALAEEREFTLPNPTAYKYYKIDITSNQGASSTEIAELKFFYDENTYTMDTTSTTNGEVPSKVYRVDEAVEFNGNPFTKLMDTYFTTSTALKTYRTFTDKPIAPSGSIITKVKMSATGNKMTELTYDAIK